MLKAYNTPEYPYCAEQQNSPLNSPSDMYSSDKQRKTPKSSFSDGILRDREPSDWVPEKM